MTIAENIDQVVDDAIGGNTIVGAVVMVAVDGDIVCRRTAGFADREAGRPMSVDTIFRLASVSKPIVAATALALIERGTLRFDQPTTEWLPDFRPRLVDGRTPEITIRHLLTHTAGFGYATGEVDDPYIKAGISGGLEQPGLGMDENLRRIAAAPLFFEPGSAWRYGVALDVLGAIVAKAHGGTLGQAVAEYVSGPLGMSDTAFSVTDTSRLAVAYADSESGPVLMDEPHTIAVGLGKGMRFSPSRIHQPESFQSAGGGMAGTCPDFMRFLETVRTGGGPILKPETVDLALQNQVGSQYGELGEGGGFGLLSAIITDPQNVAVLHSRGTALWGGVYGHSWFVDREAGISVASFTNTAVEGCMGQFRDDIGNAVYR